eukprot:6190398-Amphidinium_carterae.1
MPEETRKQYMTVTGEDLTIKGWKAVTLIIGAITMQICFILANVQSPLRGLSDIDENTVTVHTGNSPHIEKKGWIEQLHPLGAHLHAAATVLPGLHKPNEIKLDSSINSTYSPSLPTTLLLATSRKSVNKPISPNNFDSHNKHPNKNKIAIPLHTCHTDLGVQSTSRPKDNLYIIDAVDSRNNL